MQLSAHCCGLSVHMVESQEPSPSPPFKSSGSYSQQTSSHRVNVMKAAVFIQHYYLCQGGHVFRAVCLLVSRITEKLLARLSCNLMEGFSMGQGRTHFIVEGIQIRLTNKKYKRIRPMLLLQICIS